MLWTRAFLVMSAVLMLIAIAVGGAFASMMPMLVDRGNNPVEAARIAGLAGVAVIAGRGGIGWLLDRFNAARLLACICFAVVASLLLLTFAHGRLADAVAAFLLGSVLGAEVDFTAFLVRRYFRQAAFSRLYGIGFGLFALAIGIGPILLGYSFDHRWLQPWNATLRWHLPDRRCRYIRNAVLCSRPARSEEDRTSAPAGDIVDTQINYQGVFTLSKCFYDKGEVKEAEEAGVELLEVGEDSAEAFEAT